MPKIISERSRAANRFRDWIRGECKRQGIPHKRLADELLISEVSFSRRMTGDIDFSLDEIIDICSVLGKYTFGGAA